MTLIELAVRLSTLELKHGLKLQGATIWRVRCSFLDVGALATPVKAKSLQASHFVLEEFKHPPPGTLSIKNPQARLKIEILNPKAPAAAQSVFSQLMSD